MNNLISRRHALSLSLAFATAPAWSSTTTATRPVEFVGLGARVPERWRQRPPATSMRAAEFSVPGSPSADVIVYYFGTGQGGSTHANIARWHGQFSTAAGGPVDPEILQFAVGPLPVTLARFVGRYARGTGAGRTAPPIPGQALHAAVVDTPRGKVIVQLFGRREVVSRNAGDFEAFLRSLVLR